MTADELVAALARCRHRIKVLRDDNQRVWDSREEWKRKHATKARENTELRRQVKRARLARDEACWRLPARGAAPWHNTTLTRLDIKRIERMPVRD